MAVAILMIEDGKAVKIDAKNLFGDRVMDDRKFICLSCTSTKEGTYPATYYVETGFHQEFKYYINTMFENICSGTMIVNGVVISVCVYNHDEIVISDKTKFVSFRDAIGKCIMDDEMWG